MFKLEGTHNTLAVELLDQYTSWRLKDILEDAKRVPELQDVAEACRLILAYVGESIE
jgi:hypothetical protein